MNRFENTTDACRQPLLTLKKLLEENSLSTQECYAQVLACLQALEQIEAALPPNA